MSAQAGMATSRTLRTRIAELRVRHANLVERTAELRLTMIRACDRVTGIVLAPPEAA